MGVEADLGRLSNRDMSRTGDASEITELLHEDVINECLDKDLIFSSHLRGEWVTTRWLRIGESQDPIMKGVLSHDDKNESRSSRIDGQREGVRSVTRATSPMNRIQRGQLANLACSKSGNKDWRSR